MRMLDDTMHCDTRRDFVVKLLRTLGHFVIREKLLREGDDVFEHYSREHIRGDEKTIGTGVITWAKPRPDHACIARWHALAIVGKSICR